MAEKNKSDDVQNHLNAQLSQTNKQKNLLKSQSQFETNT